MPYVQPPPPIPPQTYIIDAGSLQGQSLQMEATEILASVDRRVEGDLEMLMRSATTNFDQLFVRLVAQAGPVKPESIILPKPTDPPIQIPLPPEDVTGERMQVLADNQEFNDAEQTFVATGNVIVRYQGSELKADKVEVNIVEQVAVAQGNVFFTRGDQMLQGSRLEYAYADQKGNLRDASGAINLGTLDRPEATQLPSDLDSNSQFFSVGRNDRSTRDDGEVRRLGFRAEVLRLDGDTWEAEKLRITNDPFSPPELELVTDRATLKPLSETQDQLKTENPRLVFDQTVSIPLFRDTLIIDKYQRDTPAKIGFDSRDKDGLFYQQNFDVISAENINLTISPQILLQRGFNGDLFGADMFGVEVALDADLPNRQVINAEIELSSLDLTDLDNQLRVASTYDRPIFGDHTFSAQYTFRDRIFNGSIGFQDVQNSLGFNIFSPNRQLGDSGINLSYQAGAQYISADRADLDVVEVGSLGRLQGAIALNRGIPIWRGKTLPPEPTSGLRYSPKPIQPRLDAILGLSGTYSYYTSDDSQLYLAGTVGLSAVLGNFAEDFFDYTQLNISYSQGLTNGESPFFFDRVVDRQRLNAGVLQQLYGPIRLGAQSSWNVETGEVIDSSLSLQYDRRTYAFVIRYSPTREIGELQLRISDFNWDAPPGDDVTPVRGGVERRD
ncbi:DUF3769 domain-containing protein [Thalassoporum mexicanum]|uniref:DUF3769 domain-containing protein n=1 Tax=Thalassoporum mexicanum TaxID=3457544 RepID=UPI0018DC8D1A|nr:DUF3769 domain-containing protein [Pseudanabaena sp. PCC 7367]